MPIDVDVESYSRPARHEGQAPCRRPFPSISMQMLLQLIAVSMRRMSCCVLINSLSRQLAVLALE